MTLLLRLGLAEIPLKVSAWAAAASAAAAAALPGAYSSRRLCVRMLLMLMPSSPALVLCLLALLALLVLLSQMPQERALHLPQHRSKPAMLCPPPAAHWADPLPAATISCDCGVRVDSVECRQRRGMALWPKIFGSAAVPKCFASPDGSAAGPQPNAAA